MRIAYIDQPEIQEDASALRAILLKVCTGHHVYPVFEYPLAAMSTAPAQSVRATINECDLLIGVYDLDSSRSEYLLELHDLIFDIAGEYGLERMCFIREKKPTRLARGIFSRTEHRDPSAFERKLYSQVTPGHFSDFDELAAELSSALIEWHRTARPPDRIAVHPVFGTPEPVFGDISYTDVFVIMPFDNNLPHSREIYEQHIHPAVEKSGLSCKRGDDFFTDKSIMNEIWTAIYRSRVCIADCTGRNPNVFYEIGIAHTIGKPTILISQSANDVPFDVKHIRYIVYENTPDGLKTLEGNLERTLNTLLGKSDTKLP